MHMNSFVLHNNYVVVQMNNVYHSLITLYLKLDFCITEYLQRSTNAEFVLHPFIHSYVSCIHVIHSCHSFRFIHSFMSCIPSFLHSFIHSSIHYIFLSFMSCIHSFISLIPSFLPSFHSIISFHSFISLRFIHFISCIPSFLHAFHSFLHSFMSFIHSFHSCISCTHSFHAFIHSFLPSFIHSIIHLEA